VHALLMLTLLLLLLHVRAAMCVERHTLIPTTAADTPMTTAGTRAQARLDLCDTAGVRVGDVTRRRRSSGSFVDLHKCEVSVAVCRVPLHAPSA